MSVRSTVARCPKTPPRWLLLAKLRQQSGDGEGYVAAQQQALKLQCMLLDHFRQSDKMGAAAAAAAFDKSSSAGANSGGSGESNGVPVAAAAMTASASGKAASMCYDLAEYHRQQHQYDKVWQRARRLAQVELISQCTACMRQQGITNPLACCMLLYTCKSTCMLSTCAVLCR